MNSNTVASVPTASGGVVSGGAGAGAHMYREGVWRMALAMLLSGTIGLFVIESGVRVELVVLARCAIGALVLGLWIAVRREWVAVGRRDMVWMAVGGVALVVNWVALFHAYAHAGVGIATVVYHVQPFFLVLVAALGGEAIGWRKLPFMVLALVGVILSSGVVADANHAAGVHGSVVIGVLLSLSAAALYTLTVVATRRVKHVPPAQTAMLQMIAGGLILALWALPALQGTSALADEASTSVAKAVICVLILGVVHTAVMYVLMYGAFQRLSAAAIAILSFIYPALAMIVDLWWFGVRPGAIQWLGIALIVMAISGYRLVELRK